MQIPINAKEKTAQLIRENVINAYGNVLFTEEGILILEKNVVTLEKNLKETKQIYLNGFTEEENVEQLQITLATIKSQLSKTKQLNMASAGTGSVLHLMGEFFQDKMGIKWMHIPYKGSGPALLDLAAGRTDVSLDLIPSAAPLVKSGQLRALAVTSSKRSPALPDVPTLTELGYAGLEMG